MKQYIIMGDIVKSRRKDQAAQSLALKNLISHVNKEVSKNIISPLVITLGDEFQGVVGSLAGCCRIITEIEEQLLKQAVNFELRYVINFGPIDTPINRKIAHGMMGEGLTQAREMLDDKQRGEKGIKVQLPSEVTSELLTHIIYTLLSIRHQWKQDDGDLILKMLKDTNNASVAEAVHQNRSQVWKRRKNLMIEEYRSLKQAMLIVAEQEGS